MREKLCFDSDWYIHIGNISVPEPPDKSGLYKAAKTQRAQMGPASVRHGCKPDFWGNPHEATGEKWSPVSLPHDYIIRQTPSEDNAPSTGYFKYQNAWYVKYFTLDTTDSDRRITLLFDGVSTKATVYVNGSLMYKNNCGYTPFEVDITDVALFGEENKVAVFVESGPAHEGWWYEGAGIYRHVWLKKTDTLSVEQWGVFAAPEKVNDTLWSTKVQTELRNDSFTERTVSVTSTVMYNGERIAEMTTDRITVSAKYKTKITQIVPVIDPKLWGIDTPELYTLHTTVSENGETIDELDTSYGYRTIEFDPDNGFLLNGVRTKINGVCCHQDFGLTGRAIPDNICRYKVRLIKQMGANGYRTSHYPHTEAVMDALDRAGIVAMDETRWFESSKEGIEQLETLIKRDRNHPSVVMWSIGNEEVYASEDRGRRIAETMYCAVKRLDTTRPVTMAVDKNPLDAKVYGACDIIGVNYNLELLDDLHAKYPDKCIFSSENCASGSRRDGYIQTQPNRLPPSYDQDTNNWFRGRQYSAGYLNTRDWLAGGFQWIAIDHRGECQWPNLSSLSGALDMYLLKKDSFYLNQSLWLKTPMLHLFPHMNLSGREGERIKFWVYTNCDEAELFYNGESLGRKKIDKFSHGEWELEFFPGKLTAVGYVNGRKVAEDSHETTGKPVKLCLRLENPNDIRANGEDIAMFTCFCEDEKGRFVPDASPFVSFETNFVGEIAGTGSINNDHTPPNCPERKMYAGLCSVAVRLINEGKLSLYARAEGLAPARYEFEVKK